MEFSDNVYEHAVINNDKGFPINLGEGNIGNVNYILKYTIKFTIGAYKK